MTDWMQWPTWLYAERTGESFVPVVGGDPTEVEVDWQEVAKLTGERVPWDRDVEMVASSQGEGGVHRWSPTWPDGTPAYEPHDDVVLYERVEGVSVDPEERSDERL